jgi:hypothetical protein
LTIGVPYELFWHLNPKKLKPFYTAYENKRKIRDEEMWIWVGAYFKSAFETVIAHFGAGLSGKTSQAKYIDKPIYKNISNNKELTEEEKIKQTKELFMQLSIMEANFNSRKKNGKK